MCELEASFQHRSVLREPKNIFRPVDIYFFFSYEDRPREGGYIYFWYISY